MEKSHDIYTSDVVIIILKARFRNLKIMFARFCSFFLFWFFGGFRCGVPLFFVILVIFQYKNR